MARPRPRRGYGVDATGRSRGDRFIKLDHGLLNSEAWQALSPDATKVLFDLWRRHNGTNNGEIGYSRREAHECLCRAYGCNVSNRRPNAALKEIQEKGFAVVTKAASFSTKTKESRTWRLTAEKAGDDRPSRDFRGWKIQNTGTSAVPVTLAETPKNRPTGTKAVPVMTPDPRLTGTALVPLLYIPPAPRNEQARKPPETAPAKKIGPARNKGSDHDRHPFDGKIPGHAEHAAGAIRGAESGYRGAGRPGPDRR